MRNIETVVIKIAQPTKHKAMWLDRMADLFSQSVQFGLDTAQKLHTSSRTKIHKASYYTIRKRFNLPSDYTRMAINTTVSLARSYYGLRKSKHRHHTSFPCVRNSQGIGLGTNAYKLMKNNNRWVLRISTGTRGDYIWLPLCVPQKFQDRLEQVNGDAKLFKRSENWYVMFPLRIKPIAPTVCDGEYTFIGVDLGIVRLATVATPDRVQFFDGRPARHRREHFTDIRRRYQRANRLDRVKQMRGKERHWMKDINHKISRQMIELAKKYDRPVIVFERLDGIRNRIHGSKKFNRMMTSWAFRELINFTQYKAKREGIPVIFVDPRGTSKTCFECGHNSRANRPKQVVFRCVACGYGVNADLNAARNIAALGPMALEQVPPDTARSDKERTGDNNSQPDGV